MPNSSESNVSTGSRRPNTKSWMKGTARYVSANGERKSSQLSTTTTRRDSSEDSSVLTATIASLAVIGMSDSSSEW